MDLPAIGSRWVNRFGQVTTVTKHMESPPGYWWISHGDKGGRSMDHVSRFTLGHEHQLFWPEAQS